MALSKSVEDSLNEAEASLRNALSYAARQERPMVCSAISDMIIRIEALKKTDSLFDMLEKTNTNSDDGNRMTFFNPNK